MNPQSNMPAPQGTETKAQLLARRTQARKATILKTKQERLARRQQYRARCFFNPMKPTMEEEPSWS